MKVLKNHKKQHLFYDVKFLTKKILYMLILIIFFIPSSAYANSSWRWISDTRPYDVLPFVIILTLTIEIISIVKSSNITNKSMTFIAVLIGNALSFAAPYLLEAYIAQNGGMYTFYESLERTPFYNIGLIYLIITILVEFPVVYNILKKHTKNKKLLIISIICANILTTLITYITERIFCRGLW